MHVHLLSKETIEQIAAGEVAERPASVIKELLDNALDAGADSISAELRDGGLSLIRVTDNGSGIEKDDIRNAFKRHATSKIRTAEDIAHVLTMGFRGEALSSIAAVSDTELVTRTADELSGVICHMRGGAEISMKDAGTPVGTTVAVRDFLYNVPVRREFLKSPQIENAYAASVVQRLALANPEVSISLTVDGRNVLATLGNGKLRDVIYMIFGAETARSLISIDSGDGDIRIHGYIGRPVLNKSRRDQELFIINKRPAGSDVLRKALEDAYVPYLMQRRFPFAVLNIELDPEFSDVNVHPQKKEIRFTNSNKIYDAVYGAVSKALKSRELIEEALRPGTKNTAGRQDAGSTGSGGNNAPVSAGAAEARSEQRGPRNYQGPASAPDPYGPDDAGTDAGTVCGAGNAYGGAYGVNGDASANSEDGSDGKALRGSAPGQDNESGTEDLRGGIPVREVREGTASGGGYGSQYKGLTNSYSRDNQDECKPVTGQIMEEPRTGMAGSTGTGEGSSNVSGGRHRSDFHAEPYEVNRRFDYVSSVEEMIAARTTEDAAGSHPEEGKKRTDDSVFLNRKNAAAFRMIGQVFGTYWIIEFNDEMYLIDQHAAHEKVNYETFVRLIRNHEVSSQMLFPPIVITVSPKEAVLLDRSLELFEELGYEIDHAGDRDYIVRAVPANLPEVGDVELLKDLIGSIFEEGRSLKSGLLKDRIATMSCKAAVKGNRELSEPEMRELISRLLALENPYFCPHGRPTIVKWSRYELDKLFKRIV